MDLSHNQLTGSIPQYLSNSNLETLDLSHNQLTGTLPPNLAAGARLAFLDISHNPLTGSIPLSFIQTNEGRLGTFYFDQTNLCEPSNPAFVEWINRLNVRSTGVICPLDDTPPVCGTLTVVTNAGGQSIAIEVSPSDAESGIASLTFQTLTNATATVNGSMGPFTQGDDVHFTTPYPGSVTFRINKTNVTQRASGVVKVFNGDGLASLCDPIYETIEAELPSAFALEQNHPNPFNPSTRIRFALPEAAPVHLSVYDVLGRRVVVLIDEAMEAGTYDAVWDGRDEAGALVPSGMYLYRIEAGSFVQARTMLLVK